MLRPCLVSGTPGERERLAQPDQRRLYRKSVNLFNGANQDSFSPDPTALPWAAQPCTTLCGDWDLAGERQQQQRAHHSGKDQGRFPRWESSLSERGPDSTANSLRVSRRSISRLRRRDASLLVLSKKGVFD